MAPSTSAVRDGSALLVSLLLVSLVLVALLAWQAVEANRSHHEVAESLLRDYAQLAADEMIRRTTSSIGYYGYLPVLDALKQTEGFPDGSEEGVTDARLSKALNLAELLFRVDSSSGQVELQGTASEAMLKAIAALRRPAEDPPYAVEQTRIDGRLRTFVYAAAGEEVVGFEVDLEEQRQWFQAAFERRSLLPPSLVDEADADLLVVRVTDAENNEVFAAGQGDPYPILSVHEPYGDAYSGIFDGLTVHVSLYPDAASKLVIGGLPRSRLPFLTLLLLLTVGLLLLVIHQLRRARALERLRTDFVSEVSHELRTPLTQIRMFAETLLLGRIRNEEEGRRSLEIIDAEARRLSHLVENILQFSRNERGVIELAPQVRELAPVVQEVVRDFAPIAGQRGVSIATSPLDSGATAAVDDEALRQILLNLLDNAVKYGPANQEVQVGLECQQDQVRLWVDDEGPGIPDADRRRIWLSFERLERDHRSAVAGTGIGLAVVRQLVELLGGAIEVAADGVAGLEAIRSWRPDLVILDLMLPKLGGFRVLKSARGDGLDMPILILTARGEEADKVRGLKLGADDYVTKPFGLLELLARVEAMLRRGIGAEATVTRFGEIEVDAQARVVRRFGSIVELAPKELDLLLALIRHRGVVVSRLELMNEVWGYQEAVVSRTVDTHIAVLRKKLEPDPTNPRHILTARKAGYRFEA